MTVFPVKDLASPVRHLTGEEPIAPFAYNADPSSDDNPEAGIDLQHVRGQEHVKRGLEAGAAGGHT